MVLEVEHLVVVAVEQLEIHMVETLVRVIKDFQEELENLLTEVAEVVEMWVRETHLWVMMVEDLVELVEDISLEVMLGIQQAEGAVAAATTL